MTSRRSFLRKVGLTGAGTAVAIVAMPSPSETARIVEGDAGATGSDRIDLDRSSFEFGLDALLDSDGPDGDEDASPIAHWQYRSRWGEYAATSPINVVFPLAGVEQGLEEVMTVLDDAGWVRSPEEYLRYAWDRRAEAFAIQHASAAETYFGTSGRLHVRCWEFEGVVSMQVHEDSRAVPSHAVAGYERARSAVESLYAAAGWHVVPEAIDLDNAKAPDHDGDATVIYPGGSA